MKMGLLKRPLFCLLSQGNISTLCVSGAERQLESPLCDKCANSWKLSIVETMSEVFSEAGFRPDVTVLPEHVCV